MSTKQSVRSSFFGGIADYEKLGGEHQYAFGRSVDVRSDARKISILPRTVRESGNTIVGLPKWIKPVPNNNQIDTSDIIVNSSFEVDTTGWGLDSDFTRSSDDAYDGAYSIKQVSTTGFENFYSDAITVDPNTSYTLTFFVKVSAAGLVPLLEVNGNNAFTSATNLLGSQKPLNDTDGEWQQVSYTFNTAGYSTIYIRIFNNNEAVTAYYDSFSLVKNANAPTFIYDKLGGFYRRTTSGSYERLRTVPNSHGNGLGFYAEDGYMYYTSDRVIGRYGPVFGQSPGAADDFLASEGDIPLNTRAITLNGSTQYLTAADSATLSLTGDLTFDLYVRPHTLPDAGDSITLLGKWDESGTTRSYLLEIFGVSGAFGDGSDGALTISTNTTQAPIDSACSGTSGTNSLSATNASFAAGQEILIVQMKGTSAGIKQRTKVQSYTTGVITTEDPLSISFNSTGSNRAQVIVLPQYSSITVNSGVTWAAKPWDGDVGGILVFLNTGSLTGAGTISTVGAGFRGGAAGSGEFGSGRQGESYQGSQAISTSASFGGGGGGASGYDNGGGGGGGAYSSVGTSGLNGTGGGNGGVGGAGGETYGGADLNALLFLGSGGGGGGGKNGQAGGVGARGAGVVYGYSLNINFTGYILANGSNSANGVASGGHGGGGGGGGVFLAGATIVLATINTAGGIGGKNPSNVVGQGGNGGEGRIHINYSVSYSISTPTPTEYATVDESLNDDPSYRLRLHISDDGTDSEILSKTIDIQVNVWQRLAVTWDASASLATFYLNGISQGSDTGAMTAIHDNASLLYIGAHMGASAIEDYFDGDLDDIRIHSNIKTESQLTLFKDVELSTLTNTSAYYKLNGAATDTTANANDLTAVNSPTYTTEIPFSDVTTRLDIDKTATGTGQVYTVETSIDESSNAKRLPFTPAKDPQKSIKTNIDDKGSGNLTFTVHNKLNQVIATKTYTNAEVSDGDFEVVWDEPWTPIRGQEYHLHITSTVADADITTGTAANLSTAGYTTYYQTLVTDFDYHPIETMLNFLAIGNGRYVAKLEPGPTYNPHALILPPEWRVRSMAKWRQYLAIGCWKGSSVTQQDEGIIFFWDGVSASYNHYVYVPEGAINALFSSRGLLTVVAGYQGDVLEYTGGDVARKVKRLPRISSGEYVEVLPGALNMWKSLLRIGAGESDSTTFSRAVYTYGKLNENFPDALTCDYPISTGNVELSQVVIGALGVVDRKLLIGWQDGQTCGVDVVDPAAPPFTSATLELLIQDQGVLWKKKKAVALKSDFEALTNNQSITLKYKVDRQSTWTGQTVNTVGDTESRVAADESNRHREMQVAIDLTTTTSNMGIYEFGLEEELAQTERGF